MWFIERFKEPSSWAGVSALLLILGVPPGVPELIGQVGAGVAALIAIVAKERAA